MSAHAALGAFAAPRATRPTRGLDETVTRSPSSRARSRVRATPRAFLGGLGGAQRTKRTSKALTSDEVVPGQGRGSPKWNEIHAALVSAKVGKVAATDFERFCAKDDVLAIDVRQALEFEEWHVPPCVSCPYAVPDPNVLRRATGYAVSIKGGLKVRNPRFVDDARAAKAAAGAKTVVVVDTKGGDLDVSPKSPSAGSSGVYDTSDSQALRAAFELTQAGDFPDVRYVKGGLPAIVDDAERRVRERKVGIVSAGAGRREQERPPAAVDVLAPASRSHEPARGFGTRLRVPVHRPGVLRRRRNRVVGRAERPRRVRDSPRVLVNVRFFLYRA
jgi:rhodanese-related sulfurtransferase